MNAFELLRRVRPDAEGESSALRAAGDRLDGRIAAETSGTDLPRRWMGFPALPTGPAAALASFVLVILLIGGAWALWRPDAPGTTIAPPATHRQPIGTTEPRTSTSQLGRPAPWAGEPLSRQMVAAPLIQGWEEAENREWCSALAPARLPAFGDEAIPREASFGGGWGIAWDLPEGPGRAASGEFCPNCGRSAFGVAGVGLPQASLEPKQNPTRIEWEDGSLAVLYPHGMEGTIPEGPSTTPVMADLHIAGGGCLYQVWSHHGRSHLESLVEELRYVEGLRAAPVPPPGPPTVTRGGSPPWDEPTLDAEQVVPEILEEWRAHQSRAGAMCPLMTFADLGMEGPAEPRPAGVGVWGVAWDREEGPGRYASGTYCVDCGRSAMGLGAVPRSQVDEAQLDRRPYQITWSDGSKAAYGLELKGLDVLPEERATFIDAETGERGQVPYSGTILVEGDECAYQLWTAVGRDHLEYLLSQLRYVEGTR